MAKPAVGSDFKIGPSCPPVGAESLIPVCRALAVASWPCGAEADGDEVGYHKSSTPPQVFSTRRPRDAIAGFTSGLKTMSRSIAAGAAALAATPDEASKVDGYFGMLQSFGGGVLHAVGFPCAGAAVAVAQCVRGVANTPTAFVQSLQGFQWDDNRREWRKTQYNLQEEAMRVRRYRRSPETPARSGTTKGSESIDEDSPVGKGKTSQQGAFPPCGDTPASSSSSPPKAAEFGSQDSENYYALLKVHPKASPNEIRRAYYKASRLCHPDKVGGDRRAVVKFQRISEAYKVLRSPDLRRAYDRGGNEAVTRMSTTVDLGTLYSVVMSGSQWEPYVGRLALSRVLASETDKDVAGGPSVLESLAEIWCVGDAVVDAWQTRREIRCALELAERLRPAVSGEELTFERVARDEAARLADAPFAPAVLEVIAAVYESEALRFLGALRLLDPRREMAQAKAQSRLMAFQANAAAAGVRAVLALHRLLEDEGGGSATRGARRSDEGARPTTSLCLERPAVQAQLPTLAAALWSLTVLDIEGTLRRVCRRVLRDSSKDLPARVRRANALRVVAAALREAAATRAAQVTSGLPPGSQGACSPGVVGIPGEDAELLRNCVQEAAIQVASGVSPGPACATGCGSDE